MEYWSDGLQTKPLPISILRPLRSLRLNLECFECLAGKKLVQIQLLLDQPLLE